jgi:hypothetical protein
MVFVTKTSLSVVDVDSTPPGISVAYDRTEGVVGPTFQQGHAPSVLAHISSDGSMFTPRIKQAYATGDAARFLVGGEDDGCLTIPRGAPATHTGMGRQTSEAATNESKDENGSFPMFFSTQTTAGLKLEFSSASGQMLPSGFVFGYRRKEASAIRVARIPASALRGRPNCTANNGAEHVVYPAVIASIDLRASRGSQPAASDAGATGSGLARPQPTLDNCQFFATGDAAKLVARRGLPNLDCNSVSSQTFSQYYLAKQDLQEEGLRTLGCYVKLRPDQRPAAWKDVTRLNLWGDLSEEERDPKSKAHPEQQALAGLEASRKGGDSGQRALAAADVIYAKSVGSAGSLGGFEDGRVRAMQAHRKLVCDLASSK